MLCLFSQSFGMSASPPSPENEEFRYIVLTFLSTRTYVVAYVFCTSKEFNFKEVDLNYCKISGQSLFLNKYFYYSGESPNWVSVC